VQHIELLHDAACLDRVRLRALDIETGNVAWEVRQFGSTEANYSGVLATSGGVVFYGETAGGFSALDARSGNPLWHFDTTQIWKGSPMTSLDHGRQYVAIAGGSTIYSFALDSGAIDQK
jgi:alcohol dehydrogenase (cytochrome c)